MVTHDIIWSHLVTHGNNPCLLFFQAFCSCEKGFIPNPNPAVSCIPEPIRCQTNKQCPEENFQCHNGEFCAPVCTVDSDCGANQLCKGTSCRAICRGDADCNSDEICQGLACQKACRSDVDCPGERACHGGQCIDPCSVSYCGANAECRTRDHVALCSCPPPLVGDPLQGCGPEAKTCAADAACPGPGGACLGGLCSRKCLSAEADCLHNEVCKDGTCKRICSSSAQCADGTVCIDR